MKTMRKIAILLAAVLSVAACSAAGEPTPGPGSASPVLTPGAPAADRAGTAPPEPLSDGGGARPNASGQAGTRTSAAQPPFSVPDGYRAVSAASYQIAIPGGWTWTSRENADSLLFQENGQTVGETEILGWFDADTWKEMKPNHAEQTDFREVPDLLSVDGADVRLYRIELTHTKPAAARDPDWEYKETRWYVAVKETGRAYGFYFSRERVEDATMRTILSTYRLGSGAS
jgi:hypothetical protein